MNTTKSHTTIIDEFLSLEDVSPATATRYKSAVNVFFNWLEKHDLSVRQPQKSDVIRFKAYMNANLSDNTKALYITALRKFFRFLSEVGIYENITTGLKYPKKYKGHRKHPLSDDQVEKLISSIDTTTLRGKRDFAIINLMLLTGLRSVEVRRIQIKDIETRNKQTILYVQGKGETDKFSFIPLIDEAYYPIEDYLNEYANKFLLRNDSYLFTSLSNNNKSNQLTSNGLSSIIKGYFEQAQIKDKRITAHSLRHTAAMKYIERNGNDVLRLKEFLRHSYIETSMIYIRLYELQLRNNDLQSNPMREAYKYLNRIHTFKSNHAVSYSQHNQR